jgi:hypothetical protein
MVSQDPQAVKKEVIFFDLNQSHLITVITLAPRGGGCKSRMRIFLNRLLGQMKVISCTLSAMIGAASRTTKDCKALRVT